MNVKMSATYLGNTKVKLQHLDSGATLETVAPKDNNGDGSSFSPTDLLASSLASCMLTIVGIVAEQKKINIDGSSVEIEKIMQNSPRRVAKLVASFILPSALPDRERKLFENAAMACPVHQSLHPEIEIQVSFKYSLNL
jgi:putative redox protein